MKLRNLLLLAAGAAVVAHYWNDLQSPLSLQQLRAALQSPAPSLAQNPLSSLLPKHKPVTAGMIPRHKPGGCDVLDPAHVPCYAITTAAAIVPPVPDRGGNSVIVGLLHGSLTAIEPNVVVCVTPILPIQTAYEHETCSVPCKRGELCSGTAFAVRPILNGDIPVARVSVLNADQRSGAGHAIASFTLDPLKAAQTGSSARVACDLLVVQKQDPQSKSYVANYQAPSGCVFPVADQTVYGNNATVTIGFDVWWTCPHQTYPVVSARDWTLKTPYALVLTHFCAGLTLDGILFKLLGGGTPQPTAGNQNVPCASSKPRPSMMHIIQFVSTACDSSSGNCASCDTQNTHCSATGYYTGAGGNAVLRTYGQWYLDDGGTGRPCLIPERMNDGAHLVNDEASANLGNGTPLTKTFVDFVMRGTQVTEVIKWTRQGLADPTQYRGRQLTSTYSVSLDNNASTDKTLPGQFCAVKQSITGAKEQESKMLAAVWKYMGC